MDLSVIIPTFNEDLEITIPAPPEVTYPSEPGDPPEVGSYEFPADPNITLPDVPVLEDIAIPDPPENITFPDFTVPAPSHDIEAPGNSFIYDEGIYASDLGDALDARLLDEVLSNRTELSDGTITYGSGVPAVVEEAIYARLNDKLEEEIERSYIEANTYFSAKGHDLPPGALSGRILEANKEAARKRLDNANAVMIQAFELAQKNNQFIITSGLQREQQLLDHFNQVANRALDAAKFVQQAAILVYQAKVDLFKADMQLYITEAQVYEIKIRANLAFLEKYKLELEGARLRGDLRMQEVQLYSALVAANEALVRIFATQVESVKVKYDADATRVQAFATGIQAYTAQINAITARYDAYRSQISGEVAKSQVYAEKVRAFLGRLEGAKITSDIDINEARFTLEYNNNKIQEYVAEISGYTEKIKAITLPTQIEFQRFDKLLSATQVELDSNRTQATVDIEAQKATISNAERSLEAAIQQAQININAANAAQALMLEALKSAGSVASQLAASSMSSIHASASMSHSTSKSRSYDETKDVPTISYIYQGTV